MTHYLVCSWRPDNMNSYILEELKLKGIAIREIKLFELDDSSDENKEFIESFFNTYIPVPRKNKILNWITRFINWIMKFKDHETYQYNDRSFVIYTQKSKRNLKTDVNELN